MDESRVGQGNNFFGHHHSAETKARLSAIARQRKASPLARLHLSESHMGERNPMFGKAHSPETKLKISRAKKGCPPTTLGRVHTPESKARMSAVKRGNHYSRGHRVSDEAKLRMSTDRKGKPMSDETRQKMSVSRLEKWRDQTYRQYTIRASHVAQNKHPNGPETIIGRMLAEIVPNEWAFVGDGKVWIESCNPDFINVNGKKQAIEHFGDYWHGERARKYQETEEGRTAILAKYGYSLLVIWEHELKHPEAVMLRIKEFCSQEGGH